MGAGKENYESNGLTVDEILTKTEEFVELGKKYPKIKLSFPFQTPLLLEYLNTTHNTDFGLCYAKCRAGVQEYSLQPDGTLFPCIYLNDKNKIYTEQANILKESNNLLNNNIESIISNDFFTNILIKLNDSALYSNVEPCNNCPYNNDLDICRPCSYQNYEVDLEFHKNSICKLILERNNNNYYINSK